MTTEVLQKPFWSLAPEETLRLLETEEDGIRLSDVKERREQFGENVFAQKRRWVRIKILMRQLRSPLIFILLIASAITLALQDYKDAGFILLAALVNAALGFYQENKAEQALQDLKRYVTHRARVIRGGTDMEIDASELVVGDIMHLSQGDRISADGRLLYASQLQVDEAILTGESLPADKFVHAVSRASGIPDQSSMLFAGTTVVSGVAEAVVTGVGSNTEIGRIATMVAHDGRELTPIQKSITRFALRATAALFVLSAILFLVAMFSDIPLLDAFLIAVATLVAAVPEGLPVVMTVILAIGVERLSERKGIVRKLAAAETLGSTTVILTDKTGTLTQAKMQLTKIRAFSEPESSAFTDFMFYTALLNVDLAIENPNDNPESWRVSGKPVETALAKAAAKRGLFISDIKEGKKAVHILPFNSRNKFSATVFPASTRFKTRFSKQSAHILSMMGAPESLLDYADYSETDRARILKEINTMANQGDRVLAVAYKEVENINDFSILEHHHLRGITFLGTFSFRDPLRPTVKDALETVQGAGIKVVIVTGDHVGTALAVARDLDMKITPENVMQGPELDRLSDRELSTRLPRLKIVSRVSPEGKMKIAKAFRAKGEVVAMNGDGINDAPALKEADIGIAMGTGTDVTKEVADLVLLDDNFETIVEAVKEGHRIVQNIRKAVVYLTSTICNELFLIGSALVVGLPLPLNALQILWVNFFTDSFPGVSLAFENGIDSLGDRPLKMQKGILTRPLKIFLFMTSIVSSVLLSIMYIALLDRGLDLALVRTFIFASFGTYSLFLIFAVRSLRKSFFRYNPFSNPMLLLSVIIGFALMAAAIYAPSLQDLFGTVALPLPWVGATLAFGLLNILLIEIFKAAFRLSQESD